MPEGNAVPMHQNAQRPAPLYLNPTGQNLEEQIDMLTRMIDAGGWQGRVEPYARFISITPQLAQHIIDHIPEGAPYNRKRSAVKVKQYIRAVENGDWMLTGQTIIFSRSGRLLDGGHRIAAIVAAGKKIRTLAVFGVADDAFCFLDIGRNRTRTNVLESLGVTDASVKSASMRWVYILTEGRCGPALDVMPTGVGDRTWVPDNASVKAMWLDRFANDAVFEWACLVAKGVAKMTGRVTEKSTLAALLYIYAATTDRGVNVVTRTKDLADFAQTMAVASKRARSPGAKLVKMVGEKLKAADGRLHENVRVVMTIRAIEAHLNKELPSFKNIDSQTDLPKLPKVGDEPVRKTTQA